MKVKTILSKAACMLLAVAMLFYIASCNKVTDDKSGESTPVGSLVESGDPENATESNLMSSANDGEPLVEPNDTEKIEEDETFESSEEDEELEREISETKSYYNDDGSLSYEECFDKDGVLVIKIEYYGDSYKEETYYDINRKKTKEILYNYNEESKFEIKLNENEDPVMIITYWQGAVTAQTAFEYDESNNMIKELMYDEKGELIFNVDFEYNQYGALVKEIRKGVNGHSYLVSKGEVCEIEYEPENPTKKHEYGFSMFFMGMATIKYEYMLGEPIAKFNYKIIKSYVRYHNDIIVEKIVRESDDNDSYVIKHYKYREGVPSWEDIYDKDGVFISGKSIKA